MKFIVDHNVGKLVKWLRMIGYDALFFTGEDDWQMVITALNEGRIILTRDTHILERGVVAGGRVKALFIESEKPAEQIAQIERAFGLSSGKNPFTRCLEDNHLLEPRTAEEVAGRVPPYVFRTQDRFYECPACRRIYWKGTHWEAMNRRLAGLK